MARHLLFLIGLGYILIMSDALLEELILIF